MDERLLHNLGALSNMVRRVALEAGAITLQYFEDHDALDIREKGDGSPVTIADRKAEDCIQKALAGILPSIPFIGEERADGGDMPDISASEYFWLVDPLDGTKEFIKGGPDYTVNIALIKNSEPVLGVIYAPVKGIVYSGHAGGKAMRWSKDTGKEKEIRVRTPLNEGLTVVTNYHGKSDKFDSFLQNYKINKLVYMPSSLKICTLAEGKADLYPRMVPISEWDTAAGDAILRAAGGTITDLEGISLRYGKDNFINAPFVASTFDWRAQDDLGGDL
ncbi:MAG: 3'(2'),5'-bisphosphate nucleotidase CysQ [Alphaproteobacteria bacterium]